MARFGEFDVQIGASLKMGREPKELGKANAPLVKVDKDNFRVDLVSAVKRYHSLHNYTILNICWLNF